MSITVFLPKDPSRGEPARGRQLSPWDLWAGLCRGGTFSTFKARIISDALIIERGGPSIQGGLGAVRNRIDRRGIATATVAADDACSRFFVAYSQSDPDVPTRTLPMQWTMMEWSPWRDRELSSSIRTLVPLPTTSGYYASYLTRTGELALLPLTDMVVNEISPKVVATDASALVGWGYSADKAQPQTASLEGKTLVIRDNGTMVSRHALHIVEPDHLWTDERHETLIVEGTSAAEIWRRASGASPAEIPPAASIAAELKLSTEDTTAAETHTGRK